MIWQCYHSLNFLSKTNHIQYTINTLCLYNTTFVVVYRAIENSLNPEKRSSYHAPSPKPSPNCTRWPFFLEKSCHKELSCLDWLLPACQAGTPGLGFVVAERGYEMMLLVIASVIFLPTGWLVDPQWLILTDRPYEDPDSPISVTLWLVTNHFPARSFFPRTFRLSSEFRYIFICFEWPFGGVWRFTCHARYNPVR